jgi:hypothetical protein
MTQELEDHRRFTYTGNIIVPVTDKTRLCLF